MTFHFSSSHVRFRREVADWMSRQVKSEWLGLDPESPENLARGRDMDRKLIDKGWFALHWPKRYGGGDDLVGHAIVREMEGYFRAPTYGGHGRYIVGPALIEFGTEEQKQRYLPAIAQGRSVICLGFTEANAGSDLAALKLRAIARGDRYILNGSKLYITYGHYSDSMLLAARTDPDAPPHKGVSIFLVDMNLPGISVRPLHCLTGHQINEVHFEDVEVRSEALLGEPNRGFYHMAVALNYERSGLDLPAKYMAQLEDVADYARQTGLWDRSDVRRGVGRLAAQLDAWRMICWRVVALQMGGSVPSWEASMAQLYRKDFNPQFGRTLLEIFGPHALIERGEPESPLAGRIEWYIREAFNNHGQGGRFVTRNVIARRGLDMPRN